MFTVNTTLIVENIVALLRPYKVEIGAVSVADKPHVLRRIQHELRRRVPPDCTEERLQSYRELDKAVQEDIDVIERKASPPPVDRLTSPGSIG